MELEYGNPVPSWRKNKKYAVLVSDPRTGKDKIVHYGDTRFEDFTQHKDLYRREKYLKRATQIRDKNGNLTKDDPTSANYWAIRHLWAGK